MENSTTQQSISLHLYSPPFKYCPFFNSQTGKRGIEEMKFFSEFGSQISADHLMRYSKP